MQDAKFADLVDDCADVRAFLEAAKTHSPSLRLDAALIQQITSNPAHPSVFYTVHARLRVLQEPLSASASAGEREARAGLQEALRREAALWQVEPTDLLREELGRIVRGAARRPGAVAEARVWEVLNLVALAADGEKSLSERAWRSLGLWDEKMAKVLRLSANIFRLRPAVAPLEPYVFDHPGNKRAVLEVEDPSAHQPVLRVDPVQMHRQLAGECAEY
jgi:hypothetical protein